MKSLKKIIYKFGIIIISIFIVISFWFFRQSGINGVTFIYQKLNPLPSVGIISDYTLEYASGECNNKNDCEWTNYGCGAGICTSNPKKYEGMASTCGINSDFPPKTYYKCSCINSVGKCGWVK